MAKKDSDIVEKAVNGVMDAFEFYSPESFDLLNNDPKKKSEILEVARQIALEEVSIAQEFSKDPMDGDLRKRLGKHLPENRLTQIENGFLLKTYQIYISKKVDAHYADFIRDGRHFYAQKKLNTTQAIEATNYIQIASIVVEAVLLVLTCVGVSIEVSGKTISITIEAVLPVIESSSAVQKAVAALEVASQGGSKWEMAKAIFKLLIATKSAGILWTIIKSLCSNMTWWEWTKTAALVTAMIIAAFATDGAALIAKIALALNSAYDFIKKLTNLESLSEMKNQVSLSK